MNHRRIDARRKALARLRESMDVLAQVDERLFTAYTAHKISLAKWLLRGAERVACRERIERDGRITPGHQLV